MSAAPSPSVTAPPRAVHLPVEFLDGIRHGVLAAGAAPARVADALRDAAYGAGHALVDQFAEWLAEQAEAAPADLDDERFPLLLEAFFHAIGWGRVLLEPLSDAVLALDVFEWGETGAHDGGCLVTTGLFAGFLGRLADAPLSVLEVDPGTSAPGRGRFLVASIEVLEYVWQAMQRGIPYEQAAQEA